MEQHTAIIGVGTTIVFAATAEDTAGALAILDYELAPGHASLPPHVHHREDGAAYILEGRLLVRLAETERLVGQGEFVWLPRQIAHALRNPGPEPARFLLVFTPGGFERCFHDLEAALDGSTVFCPETITPILARYGVHVAVGADTTVPLGRAEMRNRVSERDAFRPTRDVH
jgi:quercetin dioxygenase-like cupin family protein